MLYYCIARLQPVAGLIYPVLLFATHVHAGKWYSWNSIKIGLAVLGAMGVQILVTPINFGIGF